MKPRAKQKIADISSKQTIDAKPGQAQVLIRPAARQAGALSAAPLFRLAPEPAAKSVVLTQRGEADVRYQFSELMVIGIVALLVLGPDACPRLRTAGHLLGRLQRYVSGRQVGHQPRDAARELKKLQEEARKTAHGRFRVPVRCELAGRRRCGSSARPRRRWPISPEAHPQSTAKGSDRAPADQDRLRLLDKPPGRDQQGRRPGLRSARPSAVAPAAPGAIGSLRPDSQVRQPLQEQGHEHAGRSFISGRVADRLLRAWLRWSRCFCLMPWAGDIYDILAKPMMDPCPRARKMIATGVVRRSSCP